MTFSLCLSLACCFSVSRPHSLSLVGPLMLYDSLSWAFCWTTRLLRLSLSFILFHSLYLCLLRGPLLPHLLFIRVLPTFHPPQPFNCSLVPLLLFSLSFLALSALALSFRCVYLSFECPDVLIPHSAWLSQKGPHLACHPPTLSTIITWYWCKFNNCWSVAPFGKNSHSYNKYYNFNRCPRCQYFSHSVFQTKTSSVAVRGSWLISYF